MDNASSPCNQAGHSSSSVKSTHDDMAWKVNCFPVIGTVRACRQVSQALLRRSAES